MNSRQRFIETMNYGTPDRVPYFEEGIRADVYRAWRGQGLTEDIEKSGLFQSDELNEIELDLDMTSVIGRSRLSTGLSISRYNPVNAVLQHIQRRRVAATLKRCNGVRFLRVHRGFFLNMGVYDWTRFSEVITALSEDPQSVCRHMMGRGEAIAGFLRNLLAKVDIEAAIFIEPIGGNDGPLMSPKMYESYVLKSYDPIIDVLKGSGVASIIFRTYANSRVLIPAALRHGFNCLWACETNAAAMDYPDLRREFGRDLRLIGGIDLDALRRGQEAIAAEIDKVSALVSDGGYIPLVDGRVRKDIRLENYLFYRKQLKELIKSGT
ncbi:MAG: uroporphyrinogen decarboxylase family protein [candidate division KSB1 bacterium]|jgi:hypothetical protein|nr:uroporphyrinogen decarboxylase family protein [candidate division KSB1 bacterium]